MRGWVYVMTCRSMPGLVKVGASTKDPFLRVKELRTTGNPHEFIVEYDTLAEDPFMLESAAHERLAHYREIGDGKGSEFFRCTVEEAVIAIRALTKNSGSLDTFHKAERDAIIATEEAEAERIAEARRNEAQELKRRQEEAARLEAERLSLLRREEQERESLRLSKERIEKREAWEKDQQNRLCMSFKDKLTQAKGLEMLSNGLLVMCTSCSRPLLSSTPFELKGVICDGCHQYVEIPSR